MYLPVSKFVSQDGWISRHPSGAQSQQLWRNIRNYPEQKQFTRSRLCGQHVPEASHRPRDRLRGRRRGRQQRRLGRALRRCPPQPGGLSRCAAAS